ncbi:DUF2637 domain-containing protein [Salinactinospora qingdaonensis]|uniref:Uncharacterized protein n=1 Tax=Salinactinospora qingdaonensis TaxID=702744 RepID=A0ABP7FRM4_9ACTN
MGSFRWSRWTTVAAVFMWAVIAAGVSYSPMFELALRHGEPQRRAALFPLSVDGMIVASSMALLSEARKGKRGGLLPWSLLVLGSVASLAANVAGVFSVRWCLDRCAISAASTGALCLRTSLLCRVLLLWGIRRGAVSWWGGG